MSRFFLDESDSMDFSDFFASEKEKGSLNRHKILCTIFLAIGCADIEQKRSGQDNTCIWSEGKFEEMVLDLISRNRYPDL